MMQKTLEVILREQREQIAAEIMESYEPRDEDNNDVWGRALEHAMQIVLQGKDMPDPDYGLELNLPGNTDIDIVNNVIQLPTRTRPSDTRE